MIGLSGLSYFILIACGIYLYKNKELRVWVLPYVIIWAVICIIISISIHYFFIPYIILLVLSPPYFIFLILHVFKDIWYKRIHCKINFILFNFPFIVFIGLIIYGCIYSFCTTPKTVDFHELEGVYKVDKDMFSGKNADWQHNHFLVEITKNEIIVKEFNDAGNLTKIDRNPIYEKQAGKHEFFALSANHYYYKNDPFEIYDKNKHHLLQYQPKILAHPFSFHIIIHSDKYQNMFFIKQ